MNIDIRFTTETFVGYYSCRITRLCLKIKETGACIDKSYNVV
jgi:hypothetical protein